MDWFTDTVNSYISSTQRNWVLDLQRLELMRNKKLAYNLGNRRIGQGQTEPSKNICQEGLHEAAGEGLFTSITQGLFGSSTTSTGATELPHLRTYRTSQTVLLMPWKPVNLSLTHILTFDLCNTLSGMRRRTRMCCPNDDFFGKKNVSMLRCIMGFYTLKGYFTYNSVIINSLECHSKPV